jgi:hypothetical protein
MPKLQHISRYLLGAFCAITMTTTAAFAIGVKPVRTELIIDPGGSASATLKIINSATKQITVRPEVIVYTGNDEEGFPVAENLAVDDPRNIADWIELPSGDLILEPNSEEQVTFTVNVPAEASAGGRYASIAYTAISSESADTVKIQPAVSSLVLVNVSGEEIHDGELINFDIYGDKLLVDQNPMFAVNFANQGNIHEKPSGTITLTDAVSGQQLTQISRYNHPSSGAWITADTIPLNLAGGNVLPGSSRIFINDWSANIKSGKFIATLNLSYGADLSSLTATTEIEIDEELELNSFVIDQLEDSTNFTITLTNHGNVFEKLEGEIEIKNEFDNVIATLDIDPDREYIAPSGTATITVPWLNVKVPRGKYIAKLIASYGFSDISLESQINFNSFGYLFFYIAGGGVALVILLLFGVWFFRLKRRT